MASMVPGRVSVIIPGRCERFFQQTIDSALERATGDVEIIAIVDEEQPPTGPIVVRDDRVKLIELDQAIGQRAGYNLGVRKSSGEYVMKIDAHALLSPGYDEALKAHCPPETTVIPEMRRLDPWKWVAKGRGKTHFMYFGLDLYCHYWRDYRKREAAQVDYPEVMTGQGSCWFCRREWSDYIGLLNPDVGSWGNVGIEVSLRTWLCGGTQIVNKHVWQAHWFRRDEGGFPYALTGRDVAKAHDYTRSHYYYRDNAFEHQVRPFHWLIEKFEPPGWEAYLADRFESPRVIIYYTDSKLEPQLANAVRKQIKRVCGPIPIISVSQEPLRFGENINVGEKPREYRSMYEQLLVGLEAAPEGSICYLCEHDVFYHPSHFAFLPESKAHAYFNQNRYYYRRGVGSFLKTRGKRPLSQCVAYREMLIEHCRERLARTDFGRMKIPFRKFRSARPNVDIRHGDNLTKDGDYQRTWMRRQHDKLPEGATVTNLPGWGSPGHFEKKVGYREPEEPGTEDDAADYLKRKYRRWFPQVSPVRIPRMKRKDLAGLFRALGYKRGAEVGVRDGAFSEVLCNGVPDLSLICVDSWAPYYHFTDQSVHDRYYDQAMERLHEYRVKFKRMTSLEAAQQVEDGSLDFVYIDADHRFDGVMLDLILWSQKVRPGGMVCGHDYYRFRNSGVVQAVDLYTQMHQIDPWFLTDEKEASFFWAKPNEDE
jgi:glycosyltransferase involved in cell wall biosynthesis/predicted O-methyltransferase YrrM